MSEDPLATGRDGEARPSGAASAGIGSSSDDEGSSGLGGTGGEPLLDAGGRSDDEAPGAPGGEGGAETVAQSGAGAGGVSAGHGIALSRCSSSAQFGTPERVLGLPDGAVRLRLNPSETVGYYATFSGSATSFDLEMARRPDRSEAFSTGTPLDTNDSFWDFSPSVPADRSVLYFESRDTNLVWRIHRSVWSLELDAFESVEPVPGLGPIDGSHSDGAPYTTPSGDVLYFHSNRAGNGLFRAEGVRASSALVTPVPITFPDGMTLMMGCPVVSPDELTLYFAAHESSTGLSDIWRATRPTEGVPFDEAEPVVEVNTTQANEVPSFISEDGCRLYFDRNSNAPFSWTPPAGNSFVAEGEPDSEAAAVRPATPGDFSPP